METRSQWHRWTAYLVLTSFVWNLTGCVSNSTPDDPLQKGFEGLTAELQTENASTQVAWAKRLATAGASAEAIVRKLPDVQGKAPSSADQVPAFIAQNQPGVIAYLQSTEDGTSELRKIIYEISKDAYETQDSATEARDDALLFYALRFQARIHREVMQAAVPVMLYAGSDKVKDIPEVKSFRDSVSQHYFEHFGAFVTSTSDGNTIGSSLEDLKKSGHLPAAIEKNIHDTRSALGSQSTGQSVDQTLAKLTPDQKKKMKESIQKFEEGFQEVSFLYSPEVDFSDGVNFLIVLGNLTWGLCNTLIGAGLVLWDAVLATVSLGTIAAFPSFAWSENGHMIYVDVTGSNPLGIGGKLSMGLFELDNGTDYDFQSGHEGIHAIQSALFGPLYLPVVLASYATSGFDEGFMEEWADNWAWMDDGSSS